MEYKRLASTNINISRICFGCWAIGGHGWGEINDRDSIAAIRKAHELGVIFFDTADIYGFGHSEQVLSAALGDEIKNVVIATKFGLRWDDQGKITRDIRPETVVQALEASLRRLRVDCIPLYQIHWPDGHTPICDTLEVLVRCQEAGKIGHIGCCNFSFDQIREARKLYPIVAIQAPYNILDRRFENNILTHYSEFGINTLVYSPLAQGFLTGKYRKEVEFKPEDIRSKSIYFHHDNFQTNLSIIDDLREIGNRYEKTPAQVAIRWILDNANITCAITGIKTEAQVEENVGGSDWHLLQEEWDKLTSISKTRFEMDSSLLYKKSSVDS